MSNKLFVGGLSWDTEEQSLREAFAKFGDVTEAKIITDRETGRSRGFGFVTYSHSDDAEGALKLDQTSLDGRNITVKIAEDRRGQTNRSGGSNYDRGNQRRY